jgi:23S rRNA (guanosine2251-2'-O)-methyltransferase
MKPGKARKDRPKGSKSFSRGGNKRFERSSVTRPERREDRREDKSDTGRGFSKASRSNDRKVKRDDRRGDRPEKRFDSRGSTQDAVAGKNSVVEALRAKVPAKELVVAIKVELDEKISEAIRLAKMQIYQLKRCHVEHFMI